jgi:ParB/RepB/Spo0J family partition protein
MRRKGLEEESGMATALAERTQSGPQSIPIGAIAPSKTNPRKHFDQGALDELTDSVRRHGVLQPVLVRVRVQTSAQSRGGPLAGHYELVAGERRYRAAKAAGLEEIPAIVRELEDVEVLEIQVVENLQRTDLHPLEEADGYQQLMRRGYDVAKISERVGRSVKYVYDRVKLLALTKKAQELFLEGRFTPGHAILLARLSPKDQERILNVKERALFENESGRLWGDDAPKDPFAYLKPVSVRELGAWIDQHVRFDAGVVDPILFPESALTLKGSWEKAEKVVSITHEHYIPPEARDEKSRTYGPMSWKRADGKAGSKGCPLSVTGVIVVGHGRGEAFKVCVNKDKCDLHWSKEKRARAKAHAKGGEAAVAERANRQKDAYAQQEAARSAERERWKKAAPAILKALAERVKKAPAGSGGELAKVLLGEVGGYGEAALAKHVPLGKSAEDLVRHAAFLLLGREVLDEWAAPRVFPKIAKAFCIDVKKILDEAAPEPKAAPKKAPAKRQPEARA